MSLRKVIFWLSACLLLCSVVTVDVYGKKEPKVRTVKVDCFKGKSINKALKKHKNDELIIEIDGICDEDVLVQRDNVTLLGINLDVDGEPTDGIRAVSTDPDAPPNFGVALVIRDAANNVTVENLILTGAVLHGLRVLDSGVAPLGPGPILVKNCRLENNAERGLGLARAAVRFEDTVISGNGTGATTMIKSTFRCVNCFIGGLLQGGQHSVLFLVDSELVGSFLLNTKSLLRLRNTDQTANPDGNEFNNDSQLQADRVSSVLGPSTFSIFSSGFLDLVGARMATHDGAMTCESGSDVFCADPTNQIIGGGTSDCSSCMP